jgi:hypothetical protein
MTTKATKLMLTLLLSISCPIKVIAQDQQPAEIKEEAKENNAIAFSQDDIEYLQNCKDAQVYLSKELSEALKQIDISKFENNCAFAQMLSACKSNCKFMSRDLAQTAVKEAVQFCKDNNLESVSMAINNYKMSLDNNDALITLQPEASEPTRAVCTTACTKQQFVCNLLVRDLTVCRSFFVQAPGASTPAFEVIIPENEATFRVPVTINFPSTSGLNALTVIGLTDLQRLRVHDFARFFQNVKINGNLNVDGIIRTGGQRVVTNATNVGVGTGQVFQNKTDGVLNLRTLQAGTSNIQIATTGDTVTISALGEGDGNVVGPMGATDNAVVRFDGTTGELIQNSGVIIDDSNNVTGVNNLAVNNDLAVGNNAAIANDLSVGNNLAVAGDSAIAGNETIGGNETVTGTVTSTGGFIGNLTGNASTATLANNTSNVGTKTAAEVEASVDLTQAATSSNVPNTLVLRDGAGSFSSQTVNLNGNLNLTTNPSTLAAGNILKNGTLFVHNLSSTTNTFVGLNTGTTANASSINNTAMGNNSLNSLTSGDNNTAFGTNSLTLNTSGSNNNAQGFNTLAANTTGQLNNAFGSNALAANTTGIGNNAFGSSALATNTGSFNSAFGRSALTSNTASNNTAIGSGSLFANTTGSGNTAIGLSSLLNNTTGSSNIAVGLSAGLNLTTGNNNIDIGNQGVAGESNHIRIGNVGHERTFIAGIRGVTTQIVDAIPVLIDSAGQLGTTSSSRRYKNNINDIHDKSNSLMNLRPVIFKYNDDKTNTTQYGLIAEEVHEQMPELVVYDKDGQPETVKYHLLTPLLLNELKKLRQDFEHYKLTHP